MPVNVQQILIFRLRPLLENTTRMLFGGVRQKKPSMDQWLQRSCCQNLLSSPQRKARHCVLECFWEAGEFERLAPLIEAAFEPCVTKYRGVDWVCSCYTEVEDIRPDGVWAVAHAPLYDVLRPVLDACLDALRAWWIDLHPEQGTCQFRVRQSFVTRYQFNLGQTHLKPHFDGHHIQASFILQLHSPVGFVGGGLTVWDPFDHRIDYTMHTGDLCLLDHLTWHQSQPISQGERWVLVAFYEVIPVDPCIPQLKYDFLKLAIQREILETVDE